MRRAPLLSFFLFFFPFCVRIAHPKSATHPKQALELRNVNTFLLLTPTSSPLRFERGRGGKKGAGVLMLLSPKARHCDAERSLSPFLADTLLLHPEGASFVRGACICPAWEFGEGPSAPSPPPQEQSDGGEAAALQ